MQTPPLLRVARTSFALVALAVFVTGCGTPERGSPADRSGELPVLATVPPFLMTDQDGRPWGTRQLQGKVWIAGFVFTRCRGVCPRITSRMTELQRELSGDPGWEDLRLVSFSVDPEYDTPEVLSGYARAASADASHWRFLTGTRDEMWELIRRGFLLPVEDNPTDAAMPIAHSQQLVLLDRQGRMRALHDALDPDARPALLADVRRLLAEPRAVGVPAEVMDPNWLEPRAAAQAAAARGSKVFRDFRFGDRRFESGIAFVHRFVGDLARDFKQTHYDHGNGVAVADVDGDGRLDLYFTTQLGSNELWRSLGGGRYENVTEKAGVGVSERISVAPAFGDVDNDGDPDLFVTTVRGGNLLFENDGSGVFTDISREAGLDHVGHSSGAVFFDYDRDGLLDLFVTNVGRYTTDEMAPAGYYISYKVSFDGHLKPERYERSTLYRNLGGRRFQDVTEATGLVESGWNGDPHPADFNDDGFPDMYLINMQGHDEFYENQGGRRFVRKPHGMFPRTPFGSMGISIFDFNNDGRMDVYIVDMHTDMFSPTMFRQYLPLLEKQKLPPEERPSLQYLNTDGEHVLGNAFYRNDGNGVFTEISDEIGAENYWPWGLSHGDLNADGFQDVFIASSMNYPFRYQVNSVLLNEAGRRFVDSEFLVGVEPRRGGRTATPWFELDCSGADADHRDCEDQTGRIVAWGSLGSRSSVIYDLDDDGDLDIVALEFGSEPLVLVSDLAARHPITHLKVRLVGEQSNRSGIGAKVVVQAGSSRCTRINDGKSGYLAQSDLPLYFGLAGAKRVDRVEVRWPSGKRQVVAGPIEVNRTIEIRESEAAG